jgi:hypothetical protein
MAAVAAPAGHQPQRQHGQPSKPRCTQRRRHGGRGRPAVSEVSLQSTMPVGLAQRGRHGSAKTVLSRGMQQRDARAGICAGLLLPPSALLCPQVVQSAKRWIESWFLSQYGRACTSSALRCCCVPGWPPSPPLGLSAHTTPPWARASVPAAVRAGQPHTQSNTCRFSCCRIRPASAQWNPRMAARLRLQQLAGPAAPQRRRQLQGRHWRQPALAAQGSG